MKVVLKSNFRDWIVKNRWQPTQLADKLGVKRQSIHNWLEGKSTPRSEEVIRRLYALGGDAILDFENPNERPIIPKKKDYFQIEGGHRLEGEISIPGAKNGALPMLCAGLLTSEVCTFENVPEISDIDILLEIFEKMGAEVQRDLDKKTVRMCAQNIDPSALKNCHLTCKFRASILLLGPLLARFGAVELPRPGGCVLGARSNDVHLNGFRDFGADVLESEEKIEASFTRKHFQQSQVLLPQASVTATENLAIFAAGIAEDSEIYFTAAEVHVCSTLRMLEAMGAQIEGIGTHRLKITGKKKLKGGTFRIPPDGLLAGTYALAGILTGGDLGIKDVYHTELLSFYGLLRRAGASISFTGDELKIFGTQKLQAIDKVKTAIYPAFSTDLQSPFGVLLTQCEGESMIFETMFENRFTYLSELEKMGAKTQLLNAHQAKIYGPTPLVAAEVQSWDLRAGAAMVLAGLIAEGITKVTNINYIDRGYERFDENLRNLGARIERR